MVDSATFASDDSSLPHLARTAARSAGAQPSPLFDEVTEGIFTGHAGGVGFIGIDVHC